MGSTLRLTVLEPIARCLLGVVRQLGELLLGENVVMGILADTGLEDYERCSIERKLVDHIRLSSNTSNSAHCKVAGSLDAVSRGDSCV
jgi:hypothetical protein